MSCCPIEGEDFSLVDGGDPSPGRLARPAARNSAGRGPRRSRPSLHQRQLGRSEGCRPQSSQPDRERLAVSGHARRDAGGSDPRLAPVLPQLRLHRHALVSAHRRGADRHLSESARDREMRGADRTPSGHDRARGADFSARLPAQSRAAAAGERAPNDHGRGEIAAQPGRRFCRALRQTGLRRLRPDRDFAGSEREPARSRTGQAGRPGAAVAAPRLGRENGAGHRGGNSRSGIGGETFAA